MSTPRIVGLLAYASVSEVAPLAGPLETWAGADMALLPHAEALGGYVARARFVTYDVGDARNKAIRLARDEGYDWVFLLDADQLWEPDTLLGLLARQVPVVQALTLQREPPFLPVGFKAWRFGQSPEALTLTPGMAGLYRVAVVGGGCLLIRREAWEAIPDPWFRPGYVTGTQGTQGEDTAFSKLAEEAGVPLYLDLDHPSTHLTLAGLTAQRDPETGHWATRITVGGNRPAHVLLDAAQRLRKD